MYGITCASMYGPRVAHQMIWVAVANHMVPACCSTIDAPSVRLHPIFSWFRSAPLDTRDKYPVVGTRMHDMRAKNLLGRVRLAVKRKHIIPAVPVFVPPVVPSPVVVPVGPVVVPLVPGS